MAAAAGNYPIKLRNAADQWANGFLVINADGTATYQTVTATVTYPSSTQIQWVVFLGAGTECAANVTFLGTMNASSQPDGGTATGGCLAGGSDTWSTFLLASNPVTVTLGSSANNWANGALTFTGNGIKYKGNAATISYPSPGEIQWVVNLSDGNACSGNVTFIGSLNSGKRPKGGTASGPCIVTPATDGMDSWSSDAGPGPTP
jgi:hypothetical protein